MKVKSFDMVLHNLRQGKSPATHLEEQIKGLLKANSNLQITAAHMNTLVVPASRSSLPGSTVDPGHPSVSIFTTLFFQ